MRGTSRTELRLEDIVKRAEEWCVYWEWALRAAQKEMEDYDHAAHATRTQPFLPGSHTSEADPVDPSGDDSG